jgi:hypothetical protein
MSMLILYFDKMKSLRFGLIVHKFDKKKVTQFEKEYEIAVIELDRVNDEVREVLNMEKIV